MVFIALLLMMPLTVSAQFLMDGASIQNPMEESNGASFIFEGGIEPIQTHGASQDFLFHPLAAKSYCGDGVRDTGESCDGNNLASATCVTRGYRGGTLTCSSTCTFNETACTAATSSSSTPGGTGNTEPPRTSAGASSASSASSIVSSRSSRPHVIHSQSSISSASSVVSQSFSSASSYSIPVQEEALSSSQQSHTSSSQDTKITTPDDTLHTSAPSMPWNWRWVLLFFIDVLLLIDVLLASLKRETIVAEASIAARKKHWFIIAVKHTHNEEDDSDE